jgi:integrase
MKVRYREPYNARHSSVSWNLIVGKSPLWLAKQHGHSVQTMLEVYAASTEGAKEADFDAIKQAMQSSPRMPVRIEKPTALAPRRPQGFWHWRGVGSR